MNKEVNLTEKLKQYFGFDKFKGDQEAIIRNLLDGKNTFVLMLPEAESRCVISCRRSSWTARQ